MSASAHTAFSSFPSSARGLLCRDNYQPLTIRGCTVNVAVKGYGARVTIAYEYINETNRNQSVIAAYALPYGWHVQSCDLTYNEDTVRSHYTKSATVSSVESASAVALLGGSASSTDRSSAWCDVVSQAVPWTIIVGDAVLMTVTYAVTLPATDLIRRFEMRLPLDQLIPAVTQPANTTLDYNELYSDAVTRARYLPSAEVAIHIRAELCSPMRGDVKLAQLELDGVTQTTLEDRCVELVSDTLFTLATKGHIHGFRRLPLIFGCGVQDPEEPLRVFVETDTARQVRAEDTHAVAIGFTPRLFDTPANAELVLLVDVHSRENCALVARAAGIALAALPSSSLLNAVVLQGDSAAKIGTCVFPEGSRPVHSIDLAVFSAAIQALAEAHPQPSVEQSGISRLAEALHGLLGGIVGPLTAGPTAPGYARNVVVVTDAGETAAKAPSMIQEVVGSRSRARVHAVALMAPGVDGAKLDLAQLQLMARQASGVLATALTDDPIAVTRALVRAAAASAVPTLTNIRVRLAGEAASPRPAFPVDGGLPLIPHTTSRFLYALAPADTQQLSVIVTGQVGDKVIEYNADVDVAAQPETQQSQQAAAGDVPTMGLLHVAAATARIAYLVEEHPHDAAPSSLESREIIALSTAFCVASPYTQLVQTREKAAGTPLAGQVTVVASRYLPRYCLYPAELKTVRAALMTARAAAAGPRLSPSPHASNGVQAQLNGGAPPEAYLRQMVSDIAASAARDGPSVEALVRLQSSVDGSYAMGAQLASCVAAQADALEAGQPESCPSPTVWATAIALQAMRIARDQLTLLAAERAEEFLAAQCSADEKKKWQQWLVAAEALLEE